MLDDTENPEGTAYKAFRGSPVNTELRVCGKTGTAENEVERRHQHTQPGLLSFAPYEHPQYAVVVMVENGCLRRRHLRADRAGDLRGNFEMEKASAARTWQENA